MDHNYFKDRLSGYHDLGLPLEEMELLRRHVESCPECAKELEEYVKLDALVEKESGLDGSDEYWESLANRIESKIGSEQSAPVIEEIPKSPYKGLGWKITAVAASFALIAYIAVYESDILQSVDQKMEQRATDQKEPELILEKESGRKAPVQKRLINRDTTSAAQAPALTPPPEAAVEEQIQKAVEKPEKVKSNTAEIKLEKSIEKPTAKLSAKPSSVGTGKSAGEPPSTESAEKKKPGVSDRVESLAVEKERVIFKTQSAPVEVVLEKDLSQSIKEEAVPDALAEADEKVTMDTVADSDIADLNDSLSYWQAVRDSLLQKSDLRKYWSEAKTDLNAKGKISQNKTLMAFNEKKTAKVDSLTLESIYQVGRLTYDKEEKSRSIQFLRKYVEAKQGSYLDLARGYLDKLSESGN